MKCTCAKYLFYEKRERLLRNYKEKVANNFEMPRNTHSKQHNLEKEQENCAFAFMQAKQCRAKKKLRRHSQKNNRRLPKHNNNKYIKKYLRYYIHPTLNVDAHHDDMKKH